jgi:hypothetical protein
VTRFLTLKAGQASGRFVHFRCVRWVLVAIGIEPLVGGAVLRARARSPDWYRRATWAGGNRFGKARWGNGKLPTREIRLII